MQQSLAVIKYYAGIFNVLPPFIHALVKDLRHTTSKKKGLKAYCFGHMVVSPQCCSCLDNEMHACLS